MDLAADRPSRVSSVASSAPRDPLAELTAAGMVAVGAGLVTWAYRKALHEQIGTYDPIFWAGMVLAYLAVTWRALFGRYTLLWLWVLGVFTLLPKFLMSPNNPIYFDETAHYSLLLNVISTGRLFRYTPFLPIGTDYPGLESMGAAIHALTGLTPWHSALTLIAVVHCLLLIQVYYVARALQVPHRWAAAAGLVYATNPSFVYGFAQFSYESVAILLLLTIVRLYVEALAAERTGGRTWSQSLWTALLIAVLCFGCVVTHHLTSLTGITLLLAGALFIKPIDGFLDRKGGGRRLFVRWSPVLTLATVFGLWIYFVAPGTISYLFPNVSRPTSVLLGLVGVGHATKGSGGLRTVFSGSVAPTYEQIAAIGAPALIGFALLFAAIRWLWKGRLRSNFLWCLVVVAAYLASLPLTLTAAGDAGARRSWATTYIGVSLLPAALVFLFELAKRRPWAKRTAAVAGLAGLVVLLVGNVAAGEPVDYRFPGPYEFGSDTRSVTSESVRLASWVEGHLGARARVVTDRYTAVALTAHADAITPLPLPTLPIEEIWYDRHPPPPSLLSAMQSQRDDYLAIDLRDAQFNTTVNALFITGEPRKVPLVNLTRLSKWPWLHLLYSSKHYRLYKINFALYNKWYPTHARETGLADTSPPAHHHVVRHKKPRHHRPAKRSS